MVVIELDLSSDAENSSSETCCVESNGQEDVETDIGHVLRFDNANFSSPESQLQSHQLHQKEQQNGHKNLLRNTCHEFTTR